MVVSIEGRHASIAEVDYNRIAFVVARAARAVGPKYCFANVLKVQHISQSISCLVVQKNIREKQQKRIIIIIIINNNNNKQQ